MIQPTAVAKAAAGGGDLLVVDDSPVIRAIVGRILEDAGFTVTEASDGRAAVDLLDRQSFDVVVTDMNMPGLDGLGVLAAVRAQGRGTEVIILTGARAQDMESAIQALRLGAHDYLTKPPSGPEVVVFAVQRALEKKRLDDTNLALVAQLKALSSCDGLTGLLNRRSFDEAIASETERVRRYHHPFSLLMVDLDHFKAVNIRHGHAGGDLVLKAFASIMRAVLRESDLAYRYGGEEFAVLLPETTAEGALEAGTRLVGAVSAPRSPWETPASTSRAAWAPLASKSNRRKATTWSPRPTPPSTPRRPRDGIARSWRPDVWTVRALPAASCASRSGGLAGLPSRVPSACAPMP